MKTKRPVFLDLTKIQLPMMGVVSILHRMTGIVLFLLMPCMLYYFYRSLDSAGGFLSIHEMFAAGHKVIAWMFFAALGYHILAGVRHIVMDFGYFETLQAGRVASYVVFAAGVFQALMIGIWLW